MRIAPWIVGASLFVGCTLDSSGRGVFDEPLTDTDVTVADTDLRGDSTLLDDTNAEDVVELDTFAPDTGALDTGTPDTFVPDTFMPDTFMPDTFMPDTFMPDTFMPDTFRPDTFVADTFMPDTAAPCGETNARSYLGHCYWLVPTFSGWGPASTVCTAASTTGHPAHLAVITTMGEWTHVNGLPGGTAGYGRWIGLSTTAASSMKASFKWVNGETFSYDAWQPGHPNSSGTCVVMHSPGFTPPGAWEDVDCGMGFYSVCERD